jgi:hypothetical protein
MPYNWKDWKDDRKDMIEGYKNKFSKSLKDKWDKFYTLTPQKVDLVVGRIDNMIANYQQNTNLSFTVQEKIIAQLNAIKEIMLELKTDISSQ